MRLNIALILPLALSAISPLSQADAAESPFESLGVPVRKAGLMGALVGPGPTEGSERLYFNFRQDGGKLFLVSLDPDSGTSQQFQSPAGTGAWGFIVGPDQKIYLGTHEGPGLQDSGQILVFDPQQPDKGIQILGRPSATETYIWQFTIGQDGKLYGCTYGNAKLVSYDPKTGAMADLGRMDDTQLYTRSVCTAPDGRLLIGVGYGRANVVLYDPKTGEHQSILPEEYRKTPDQTAASVYTGADGQAYASVTAVEGAFVLEGDTLKRLDKAAPEASRTTFKDGRRAQNATLNGTYELVAPDGTVTQKTFTYEGAGSGIFMVSAGPAGRIYGGTYMPCEIFWCDPATGKMENPGNPTEVGGEIYSMLDHQGSLYVCAYPGSFLSKWDPLKPWDKGFEPGKNPREFGPLGPGHLRPRAMVHGPGDKIYIGSYPEYGKLGGSLGVWDPETDKLTDNFHHLIKNQSIVSLAFDSVSGLMFGGSSTAGGGGSTPSEPEAKFFGFDCAKKELVLQEVPYPGDSSIRTLVRVDRKVFGVSGADGLFVYDIEKRAVVHKSDLDVGSVQDCGLSLWKDGALYGLSEDKVFKLDPKTYAVTVLATYPGKIRCGLALDDRGIYFGDQATLMRFNWAK